MVNGDGFKTRLCGVGMVNTNKYNKMIGIKGNHKIGILMTIGEAEIGIAALKALNEKLEREHSMTQKIKDQLITSILFLEFEIATYQDLPERLQEYYKG